MGRRDGGQRIWEAEKVFGRCSLTFFCVKRLAYSFLNALRKLKLICQSPNASVR